MRGKQMRRFGAIAAVSIAAALLLGSARAQTVTPSTSDDTENSGQAAPPASAPQKPSATQAPVKAQAPLKTEAPAKREAKEPIRRRPPREARAQTEKKVSFIDLVVTNRRSTGLVQLDAVLSDSGEESVKVSGPLAPGEKAASRLPHDKGCTFDLHGVFEDGATTASTGVDLCAHPKIDLVE